MKKSMVMAAAVVTAALLLGCHITKEKAGGSADPGELEGSLLLVGSTSMEKLSNAAAESFMWEHPKVTVNTEFTGSSAGVEAVLAGNADIGNSSRSLKDSEKQKGATENIVAIDGLAVVTDPSNPVENLTREELIQIYTGMITNWKELGGRDLPIVVIGREAGSGTRGAFEELLEIEESCVYANELDSTGAVMAKTASTPGAIGYVSLDVTNETVRVLSLDGIAPTAESIRQGSYVLSRPFIMATAEESGEENVLVQEFLQYLRSEKGKQIIEAVGLIPPV